MSVELLLILHLFNLDTQIAWNFLVLLVQWACSLSFERVFSSNCGDLCFYLSFLRVNAGLYLLGLPNP